MNRLMKDIRQGILTGSLDEVEKRYVHGDLVEPMKEEDALMMGLDGVQKEQESVVVLEEAEEEEEGRSNSSRNRNKEVVVSIEKEFFEEGRDQI